MKQLLILGGRPLFGKVGIAGSKNAALPILFATLLTGGVTTLHRVPNIGDVHIAERMLREWGAKIEHGENGTLKIDTTDAAPPLFQTEAAKALRGSLYSLGAGLGRFGEAFCSFPGGCNLGQRPIDQHIKVFRALGAEVSFLENGILVRGKALLGTDFTFDVVSVGATVNGILAASMAKGVTRLRGAAKEPHVVDFIHFLNQCGAKIEGAGTDVLTIYGKRPLGGTEYTLMGDEIEAGTYLLSGVATGGEVTVEGVCPGHLESFLLALKQTGAEVSTAGECITAKAVASLKPLKIATGPYPAFPSDLHPQMTALLSMAQGNSQIEERIWVERFRYVEELKKLGLKAKRKDALLEIFGGRHLKGAVVEATDLRGGAAAVIAALMAKGMTVILNTSIIDRGYESIAKKLRGLGAEVYERQGA